MEVNTLFSTEIKATENTLRTVCAFSYCQETYLFVGDWKGFITILHYNKQKIEMKIIKTFKIMDSCITNVLYKENKEKPQLLTTTKNILEVWDLVSFINGSEPQKLLTIDLHKENICNLYITKEFSILSSSWDCTLKYTKSDFSESRVLYTDKEPIMYVCELENGILCASKDASLIYLDKDGNVKQRIEKANESYIRKIRIQAKSNIFYTISNDGYLVEWKINKETDMIEKCRSLFITDEYVYALSLMNQQIVIGGEDHVVFIVDKRTFTLKDAFPVSSNIWKLTYIPNNDLLVATEDGYIRLFTKSLQRRASAERQKEIFKQIADNIVWIPALQNANIDQLASSTDELEQAPGRFFAIREGNDVIIVLYSKAYKCWMRVGKVHREHTKVFDEDGKEYDAYIIITLENGFTKGLYLNYSDDVSELAKQFIAKHGLEYTHELQTEIEFSILDQCGDEMNKDMGKNHTEKSGVIANLAYGIADMCGRREKMEDRHFTFSESSSISCFGLLDGHGGVDAVEYAQECLPRMIRARRSQGNFYDNMFKDLQSSMRQQFLQSGTTALVASFANGILSVANLGDTRCVLCREKPIRMSFDHRASEPSEREYITSKGAEIKNGRICGVLAVSRALGDGLFARYLNPEPYFKDEHLEPGDRIVLACDGVWDIMSDDEVSAIVRESPNPLNAAKSIRNQAFERGSLDNISVVVIFTKN